MEARVLPLVRQNEDRKLDMWEKGIMMRKKNLLISWAGRPIALGVMLVAFVLGMSAVAHADSLRLAYTPGAGGFSYGDGGEFGAYDLSPGFPYAAPMPAVSRVDGPTAPGSNPAGYNFQTFCVQSTVTFSPTTWYVTSEGLTSTDNSNVTKNLTVGAAFLFDAFWNGTLTNTGIAGFGDTLTHSYRYDLGANRQHDAGVVQWALWAFQGQTPGFADPGGQGALLVAYAESQLGGAIAAYADYTGSALASGKSVRILQLTDVNGVYHQAQLVEVVPLPQSALAGLALLGLIAGVSVWRRKPTLE